jgi:Domain of unknown function(DUF2779)
MSPTTLTKTRFAMALECPRKLDYARDKNYYDARVDDEFLASLAEGGHQVGELARQMFPGGLLISDVDPIDQIRNTETLLAQPAVTLFEATIQHDNLLVRCDILRKTGNAIELIEVKAKGFDARKDRLASTNTGGHPVLAGWRPYVYDVAYQAYVLALAHPEFQITPYLMLLDKQVRVSIPGLNTMFPVKTEGRRVTVSVSPTFSIDALTPPILRQVNVSQEVAALHRYPIDRLGTPLTFQAFVDQVSDILKKGLSFPVQIGRACKTCQYYIDPDQVSPSRRSGWTDCMAHHTHAPVTVARRDTVFGLHKLSEKALMALLKSEPLALAQVAETALDDAGAELGKITGDQRRRLQWIEAHDKSDEPYILEDRLREKMATWQWPLHFIDFETSRPALPYHAGRTPYDQILFQFSHHVLTQDGRLEHRTQCIEATPGKESSVPVLRALQAALSTDSGTVLHWWTHEATVLTDIREQIEIDLPTDRDALEGFVDSLLGSDHMPGRLVDLGILVSKTVFYSGTSGSSSIKKVLPAVLRQNDALRARYGTPMYGTSAMPSLNFTGKQWVVSDNGITRDPYDLLDPLFSDPELQVAIGTAESGDGDEASEFIRNGGGAIIAYDQLQQPTLPASERTRLTNQLFRYCELDTLAMVMVYQALSGHGLP